MARIIALLKSSLAAHQQLLQNQHSLQFQSRFAATASGIHASFRYDISFATAPASPPIFAAPPARIGPRLAIASQHDWARRQPPLGQPAFVPQQAGASSQACASLPPLSSSPASLQQLPASTPASATTPASLQHPLRRQSSLRRRQELGRD